MKVFADTHFYLAFVSPRDSYHNAAIEWSQRDDLQVVTTEYILVELGNSLTRGDDRRLLVELEKLIQADERTTIIPAATSLLREALDLFANRLDKFWSLTDCTSFIVMQHEQLKDALTADRHYEQAGFNSLLKR